MAIKIADVYLNTNPADANYPGGSFKNASSPTATDGTPFEEQWANDMLGFQQALLALAGVTPSGVPDTAAVSQHLQALLKIAGLSAASVRNVATTGSALAGDTIVVLDGTAGALDFTLLAANDPTARAITVQRSRADVGANTVRILPNGSDTIGLGAELELLPGESYRLVPDGTSDYLQI